MTSPNEINPQPASTGAADVDEFGELKVRAHVETQGSDHVAVFTHNRSTFRPWAYPMPRDVAERIERAVNSYAPLVEALDTAFSILDDAHEINPSNYDHDEVCSLNAKMVEAYLYLKSQRAALKAATGEAAHG